MRRIKLAACLPVFPIQIIRHIISYYSYQLRRICSSSCSAWSKGRRPPSARAVFIKWTRWTFPVAVSRRQHHKHCRLLLLLILQQLDRINSVKRETANLVNHKYRQLQVSARVQPPNLSPLPWGSETPTNAVCHWTPQVYLPNGM